MPYRVYILLCSDGSYYTGSTSDLDKRLWQHQEGLIPSSYTFSRRPVKLLWYSEETPRYSDALAFEHQVKGWSRTKKEALMRDDFKAIHDRQKEKEENKRKNNPRPERRDDVLSSRSRRASYIKYRITGKPALRLRSLKEHSASPLRAKKKQL